ncbi:MAG: chromosomal replication initiator protein DnaA [Clostridiales bacterium]|nr:chromosomal replication initiator protein DnaA [Clostridiales bacterium]
MDNIGDLSAIWQIMLADIREDKTMPETAIDLWFGKLNMVSLSPDKVVFAADCEMKRGIIAGKYTDFLAEHTYRVIGFNPEVEIIVDPSLADAVPEDDSVNSPLKRMRELKAKHEAEEKLSQKREFSDNKTAEDKTNSDFSFFGDENEEDGVSFAESAAMELEERLISEHMKKTKAENSAASSSGEKRLSFNSDYTFENFIVGSSNKLAHAAAFSVAESPGQKYNPLFIYGHSGLGKTHLMYAIANRILEKDSSKKVIYVKGEEFMNQLIESLRVQKNSEFREKYRKADMLLIDDIQFIAGKESTQQEFFHTFDALYEDHKQLIITSDKPPREMVTLEERIRSRFESGLIIDIQPPDFELRLAILQNKADANNLVIPTDVMTYLAERLQSNIRQIEGVIKKLGANHFLYGMPVTMEMVRSSIPEFIKESESETDLVNKIIECVARRFNTTPADIYGRKRTKEIKNARNVAMKIIRDMTTLSLPKIGAIMGNRDYSTVHSNLLAVDKQVSCDPELESTISDIIKEVKRM